MPKAAVAGRVKVSSGSSCADGQIGDVIINSDFKLLSYDLVPLSICTASA